MREKQAEQGEKVESGRKGRTAKTRFINETVKGSDWTAKRTRITMQG